MAPTTVLVSGLDQLGFVIVDSYIDGGTMLGMV